MSTGSSRAEIGAEVDKTSPSPDEPLSAASGESIKAGSAGKEVDSDELRLKLELGKSHNFIFFVLPSGTASGYNYICSSTQTNPEMR